MANQNASWFSDWETLSVEYSQDAVIDSWLLMRSPWPMIALFITYILFALKSGPQMINKSPKYNLRLVIAMYNMVQVYLNAGLIYYFFWTPGFASFAASMSCENPTSLIPKSPEEETHVSNYHLAAWYFLVTKILDLMDTVFFVMNGKSDHVSFLHVYHHSTMFLLVWFGLKYIRPINTVFPGILNCAVHVFMYTYYLVCIFAPGFGKRYKALKKTITIFQMVQFVYVGLHTMAFQYLCPVSKTISYLLCFQSTMFFILFSNFFIKQYLNKNKQNSSTPILKQKLT